jgi:hypothetical protein
LISFSLFLVFFIIGKIFLPWLGRLEHFEKILIYKGSIFHRHLRIESDDQYIVGILVLLELKWIVCEMSLMTAADLSLIISVTNKVPTKIG